jgi:hypothetical protein
MKTRSRTNVVCVSIWLSITLVQEITLNVSMKSSNNTNALFVKGNLALRDLSKTHIQVEHEKKKPFKCDLCNMMFGQKKDLNQHTDKVHLK